MSNFKSKAQAYFNMVEGLFHITYPNIVDDMNKKTVAEQIDTLESNVLKQVNPPKILYAFIFPLLAIILSVSLLVSTYSAGGFLGTPIAFLFFSVNYWFRSVIMTRRHIYACKVEWYSIILGIIARKSTEYTIDEISRIVTKASEGDCDEDKFNKTKEIIKTSLVTLSLSKQVEISQKIAKKLDGSE